MKRDQKLKTPFSLLTLSCLFALPPLGSLEAAVVPGPFIESGGLVVMEAEHFQYNTSASGHAWEPRTNKAGFAGEAAMQAAPDLDTGIITTNVPLTSPVLSYQVKFATPGVYKFWLRAWADDDSDDSVYVGLDDQTPQVLNFSAARGWMWRAKQVVVSNSGPHEVKLWMREDGAYVDRLMLTTNLTFAPSDPGPEESRYLNASPEVRITTPPAGMTAPVGTSLTIAAEATDSDGSIARVDFYVNGALLRSDTSNPYSLIWTPAAGAYEFTAVATDDQGANATSAPCAVTIVGPSSNGVASSSWRPNIFKPAQPPPNIPGWPAPTRRGLSVNRPCRSLPGTPGS